MGIFDYYAKKRALEDANRRSDEAMKYYNDLPEYEYIQAPEAILEGLPPELQAQIIKEDPTLRSTEMAALQNMQELADKGMSAQDAYNYMQSQQRTGQESRGQQEAIINEMLRKGMGGSGIEYALRTQAAQNAVDRFSQEQAAQAAKNAEMRALANLQQGEMAGNLRGQDYTVNSTNANILNQFAQDNARNRQDTMQRNIDRQNLYNQGETAERRNVQSGNVNLAKQIAQSKANTKTGQAAYDLAQGENKAGLYNDIGEAAGKLGGYVWNKVF